LFTISYEVLRVFTINTITFLNTTFLNTILNITPLVQLYNGLNLRAVNPRSFTDILSDSWMNVTDAKKAVKIWILDRGEHWSYSTQKHKTRLQLHNVLQPAPFTFQSL
jgi:hypothetical protein